MGKLFFYSDQVVESPGNRRLDNLLLASKELKFIKIGYIPSTEDKEKTHFNTKVKYYREYGITNIMFFDLYDEFNSLKIDELIQCDIIHLSAGDPIKFREAIKKRNMEMVLSNYFKQGGTIVGVSGGAVQLGKSTKLFQMFIGDSGSEKETLQLVDFEFLPHYNRWNEKYKTEVHNYAKTTGTTVYAGNDGDGIIVEDNKIQMVGDIVVISGQD
ncbi:Type 1 glutamine amidotransferase-like domain-containing protein [Sutcliffiella deserti]|uniref:Type 1 glutamine amidotransferase-like domain-containing protein n=1 Tax=Sutcliffiella deserti TaxID=2875501 RepID=UPI001CBC3101|nr:Type 1 glutamine amidotransferase-like domain-containing protein [Sutcliffiella deserti]